MRQPPRSQGRPRSNRGTKPVRQLATEEVLRLIVEHAPVALAMLDNEMRYLVCSNRWLVDYGLVGQDLIGRSHYEVFPEIPERWKAIHRRALTGEVQRCDEDRFDRADGSVQWLRWEILPWRGKDGAVGGVVMFTEEITERKRQQEALARSEASLSNAQTVANLGSWELDLATLGGSWSPQLFRIFGRDPALGVPSYTEFLDIIHPDDRVRIENPRVLVERELPQRFEFRILLPDHGVRWMEARMQSFDESGGTPLLVGTTQDITERKLVEQELEQRNAELHRLTQRLVEVQETERRNIAYELHDEVGQLLTGLRLSLELVARGVNGDPLERAKGLVQELMQRVRNLSLSLRPSMLDDLGLVAALRWQCDSVAAQGGIEVHLAEEGIGRRRFAPTVETAAFRIIQESLTNVLRHASGAAVTVRVRADESLLALEVVDGGPGFDLATVRAGHVSIGLSGMRERAESLGGRFTIESTPGKGTRVSARLPLAGEPPIKAG